MRWAYVCFILLPLASTRQFNNPVIPLLDSPDPGVVYFQGKYYAVSTTNNDLPDKFPIHVSTDLQTWDLVTYVINGGNRPVWSTNAEYWAAEIHVLSDNQFRVYYTTRDMETRRLAIGAAFATNITGPYYSLDRPLVLDTSQDILDATLLNDGTLFLIWKGATWMYLRQLHSDGLSFDSDTTVFEIMKNDLPWEGGIIEGPWVVKRNNTFYMFYSGSEYCTDKYAVGVARSASPTGPWIKKGDPILVSDNDYKGPGHCSVVKDVDNINDVMVYHAYKTGQVCTPYPRLMCAQSVAWGTDGWPYMTD